MDMMKFIKISKKNQVWAMFFVFQESENIFDYLCTRTFIFPDLLLKILNVSKTVLYTILGSYVCNDIEIV